MKRLCQQVARLKRISTTDYWSALNFFTKGYTIQEYESDFGVGAIQSLRLFEKFGIVKVYFKTRGNGWAAFFATPKAYKKIKLLDQ